jgi:hypothetical protein
MLNEGVLLLSQPHCKGVFVEKVRQRCGTANGARGKGQVAPHGRPHNRGQAQCAGGRGGQRSDHSR